MERRSWPWKKKSPDQTARPSQSAVSQTTIFPAAISFSYEDPIPEHKVEPEELKDSAENGKLTEAVLQWQQSEDKVNILTDKLASSMSDIAEKNEIVKRNTKAVEEAVSGWKKAESEALALKQQLEVSCLQKKAGEDHVAHLNGAVKECMKQVQQVRGEQEQKIQDAILKKSQQWDKIRAELEATQADLEWRLLQLGAESDAMSKSLQERARTIVEVSESKAKAETEVNLLQVRIESMEKEISSLKYEVHLLNKELQIRNEERDHGRKAADVAHKQHLENVKKIAKLESDCERLRALVRKKLPGPAALAQMRMEVDTLGRNMVDAKRRRALNKGTSPTLDLMLDHSQGNAVKEIVILKDRLLAMGDETKLLKEVLSKRNGELQAARQMCARTASKLSMVEGQLESLLNEKGLPKMVSSNPDASGDALLLATASKEPSLFSRSEDGANDDEISCAESWASALITELAYFKKEKTVPSSRQSTDSCNLDNIGDSLVKEGHAVNSGNRGALDGGHCRDELSVEVTEIPNSLVNSCCAKLEAANQICKGIKSKLESMERQIGHLKKPPTDEMEDVLVKAQESLVRVSEVQEEVSNLHRVLEELQTSSSDDFALKLLGDSRGNCFSCRTNIAVEGSHLAVEEEAAESYTEVNLKTASRIPSLSFVICRIVQLVECLAARLAAPVDQCINSGPDNLDSHREPEEGLHNEETPTQERSRVGCGIEKQMLRLLAAKENLVQGKSTDVVEFLLKLAFVLSCLSGMDTIELENSYTELASINSSEEMEKSVLPNGLETEIVDNLGTERGTDNKIHGDNDQVDSQIDIATPSVASMQLQRDLEQMEQEKTDVAQRLAAADEELKSTKSLLADTEKFLSDLKCQQASLQEFNDKAERDLSDMTASKAELESQLKDANYEICQLREKIVSLRGEIKEQKEQYEGMVSRCKELEDQLKTATKARNKENDPIYSHRGEDRDERKLRKVRCQEREVAAAKEKLAEFQRNMIVLEKQLTGLTSTSCDSPPGNSFGSSLDSVASLNNRNAALVRDVELIMHSRDDARVSTTLPRMDGREEPGRPWSSSSKSDRRLDHVSSMCSPGRGRYASRPLTYYHSTEDERYMAGSAAAQRGRNSIFCYPTQCGGNLLPPDMTTTKAAACQRSPIIQDEFTASMYTSPDAGMMSPTAASTATPAFLQIRGRPSSGRTTLRTNLMKSMDKAAVTAVSPSTKPAKPNGSSGFGRFFSLSKKDRH